MGCGESQQFTPAPETKPVDPVAEVPTKPPSPVESQTAETVAEVAKPETSKPKEVDNELIHHATFGGIEKVKQAVYVVRGANLIHNEYGNRLFADFFFFITGFHGFHVFSGVIINIIIFINVLLGTYEKRGHYEMVEKVGLYWHFVDLAWVFVFTFFYLV